MKTNIRTISKDGSTITNHIEIVPSQFNLFRLPFAEWHRFSLQGCLLRIASANMIKVIRTNERTISLGTLCLVLRKTSMPNSSCYHHYIRLVSTFCNAFYLHMKLHFLQLIHRCFNLIYILFIKIPSRSALLNAPEGTILSHFETPFLCRRIASDTFNARCLFFSRFLHYFSLSNPFLYPFSLLFFYLLLMSFSWYVTCSWSL